MLDAQVPLDDGGVCSGKLGLLAEVALALLGLLGEDVALESLGTHDLAGTGDAEALGGALVGLHLRHCCLLLCLNYQMNYPIGNWLKLQQDHQAYSDIH